MHPAAPGQALSIRSEIGPSAHPGKGLHLVIRHLLAAVLSPLLLLACDAEEASEPPMTVPKALPGSPPKVEAALMTVEDLGDGWVDQGPTPFEMRGFDDCPATNVLTSAQDPRRVGEAQTYFSKGDDAPAPTFFESVSVWESDGVAQDRLATFATAASTCVGVKQRTLDGREATVTFTERPAPDVGGEAVSQALRFDFGDGPDSTVDLIAVRLGDVIVFTNGERHDGEPQASLDPSLLQDLTRMAVEKVERSLPLP